MLPTVLAVLLIIVLFFLAMALPLFRIRRAFRAVIKIFRENSAVDAVNAKTAQELGLAPQAFFDRIGSLRDFRPNALKALIEARIVQVTEDERLYLSETDLISSKLSSYANIR